MTATGLQQPRNTASDFAALQFIVDQMLHRMQTAMPVRVMACTNDGGVTPVGTVDVVPLVNQLTGDGTAVPHATIFKVPYSRLQGGRNAVIMDPEPGDIGMCVFASRDISAVKADPQAAADNGGAIPGSLRTYDFADAVYLFGILNQVPEQFVQFNPDGIRVVSPTLVRVEAPTAEVVADERITLQAPTIELKGDVTHTDGDITSSGKYTGQDDVIGNGTSLHTHKHSGVVPGGGQSGPPV
jgi:hypothetical protein